MAVNTTDYSSLEDAVKAAIVAAIGIGGTTPYVPVNAITIYNGEMSLSPESMAEWCRNRHGPHIVIAIEGMDDEEAVQEGGKHPRKTWQSVEMVFYLFDESLRGAGGDDSEATRGMSGKTNAPGVYKLINDVRATLSGYVAGVSTLKWWGPFWQNAKPHVQDARKQLWRMPCEYRGMIENSIDTSGLPGVSIHGEVDYPDSTPDPDVTTYPIP